MSATSTTPNSVEPPYGWFYPVAKALLSPARNLLWKIDVKGIEHVPEHGPAIIAANHISFIDSVFLLAVLPRQITFVGKAEYMDSWKTRTLFPALGMIPIDRSGGSAGERALDTAAGVLERGELFGIYPEGTRSRDGRLHKGHTGPVRLALRTGAPLLPVGLLGTRKIMPPEAKFPRLFVPAAVRIGRPIRVDRAGGNGNERLLLRQVADELMYEIRSLSGQEYVDEYATKKRSDPDVEVPVARSSAEVLTRAV
jgi:1-acyl-sn-glycerol-3-phosphate acyltransferase